MLVLVLGFVRTGLFTFCAYDELFCFWGIRPNAPVCGGKLRSLFQVGETENQRSKERSARGHPQGGSLGVFLRRGASNFFLFFSKEGLVSYNSSSSSSNCSDVKETLVVCIPTKTSVAIDRWALLHLTYLLRPGCLTRMMANCVRSQRAPTSLGGVFFAPFRTTLRSGKSSGKGGSAACACERECCV